MTSDSVVGLFLDRMSLAVRQAGVIARSLDGVVENIGKLAEALPHDSAEKIAQRSAKTRVDDIVQEVLLLAALELLDPRATVLDAEEETPSTALFTATHDSLSESLSLVIDPIDGTFAYLSGRDRYSINVGLVGAGNALTALVYFPARDDLYFLAADGCGYLAREASSSGLKNATKLKSPNTASTRVIYKNNRVPEEVVRRLAARGYEVIDDSTDGLGCPDALLKCLAGDAIAYISHTPQIRDILLGAIVSAAESGYARDWQGRALAWPFAGRVPAVVFGCGDEAEVLQACLSL
jgi:fructose-1,6-bisphosphatase/inositol monophosphatase family enzyme